jgi:Ca2+-binding EF-hand superfamily protein
MRTLITQLLLFLAASSLPQLLKAEEPSKPPRPNPETMFNRLDANKDGVITADEIPAGIPERLKQRLLEADKDGDKKLTLDDLKESFKERQAHRPEADRPRERLEGRPESGPPAHRGPEGRHEKGPMQKTREAFRPEMPKMPDLKMVFDRLDGDKDGKLSFEEFKAGIEKFHRMMDERSVREPAPANHFEGWFVGRPPRPSMAMHETGWRRPEFPGPGFQGREMGPWMDRSPREFHHHPEMGYDPQFHGYGMNPWMGYYGRFSDHPQMGQFHGHHPQFAPHEHDQFAQTVGQRHKKDFSHGRHHEGQKDDGDKIGKRHHPDEHQDHADRHPPKPDRPEPRHND